MDSGASGVHVGLLDGGEHQVDAIEEDGGAWVIEQVGAHRGFEHAHENAGLLQSLSQSRLAKDREALMPLVAPFIRMMAPDHPPPPGPIQPVLKDLGEALAREALSILQK